jgi:hypothetical protein
LSDGRLPEKPKSLDFLFTNCNASAVSPINHAAPVMSIFFDLALFFNALDFEAISSGMQVSVPKPGIWTVFLDTGIIESHI